MKVYPYLFQEMAQHQGVIEFDKHLETRLVYGNYPEVLSHPAQAEKYLIELVKTSIFTNLNPNERINKGDKLLKMVQLLAFEMGEPISYYDIGQRCGLDNETVERYIELLEKAFLLKKVPSFFNDKIHLWKSYRSRQDYTGIYPFSAMRSFCLHELVEF
jgi:predicted AAA+ superfamily ATPase